MYSFSANNTSKNIVAIAFGLLCILTYKNTAVNRYEISPRCGLDPAVGYLVQRLNIWPRAVIFGSEVEYLATR